MILIEDSAFSKKHHDITIRSCTNAIQIELLDGSVSKLIRVDFPRGDPIHRAEVEQSIINKFNTLTAQHWDLAQRNRLIEQMKIDSLFLATSVSDFMSDLQY